MLSAGKNGRLTPVGPGTPMGDGLRCSRLVGEDMLV